MHSPGSEWGLTAGYLGALNLLRNAGDPDEDTLSEIIRARFHVDTPLGRAAFNLSLLVGGLAFRKHILRYVP